MLETFKIEETIQESVIPEKVGTQVFSPRILSKKQDFIS